MQTSNNHPRPRMVYIMTNNVGTDTKPSYLMGNMKVYELPAAGNGGIHWLITLGCLLLTIDLARLKYMRRSQQREANILKK